ncbi:MAG TPA: wax ester/triacylglycerol synthase domain-containing protein [Nocardioidaceae bacterium]|nr:wax ester/triacylglycerol synthase domain-containing protein [Nocardioidaceae bacterium]
MRYVTSTGTPGDPGGGRPVIERASASDRAFLAMDTGPVPGQFGAVLVLEGAAGLEPTRVRELMGERVSAVPRLRQRLTGVPPGCGGPVWVDDPDFELESHFRHVACPPPGDQAALLETALTVVMTPLPRDKPLWSSVFVTGLEEDRSALVLVLHHALADGIGGLAVLAALVDPGPVRERRFPVSRPGRRSLALDAFSSRAQALRGVTRSWRLLRSSMGAGGGLHPPRAASCSLLQPAGTRRRLIVVRADHARLRDAAHACGATTNDAVLVAVVGALRRVLLGRGERVDHLVVTVPVSGRRVTEAPQLGNMVSPLLLTVPAGGDVTARLVEVAAQVRALKAGAMGPPPIALLGWLFRPLARLGGYRWYMNRQHRFHTLVSHLRGPDDPVRFGGALVESAAPIAVSESGNTTVYFEVLTYAGTVTVSAIVDPDHFPDLDVLDEALRVELDLVVDAGSPASAP